MFLRAQCGDKYNISNTKRIRIAEKAEVRVMNLFMGSYGGESTLVTGCWGLRVFISKFLP